MFSTDTFLSDGPNHIFKFDALCDMIHRHRSLQHAGITSAESYRVFNGRVMPRYLVLELERDGRQRIWLRIDLRMAENESKISFAIKGGRSSANDEVSFESGPELQALTVWFQARISTNKATLIEVGSTRENIQRFDDAPTLGDLRWIFVAITQVLLHYELLRVSPLPKET